MVKSGRNLLEEASDWLRIFSSLLSNLTCKYVILPGKYCPAHQFSDPQQDLYCSSYRLTYLSRKYVGTPTSTPSCTLILPAASFEIVCFRQLLEALEACFWNKSIRSRAFFSPWECGYFPQEIFKTHRKYWQNLNNWANTMLFWYF